MNNSNNNNNKNNNNNNNAQTKKQTNKTHSKRKHFDLLDSKAKMSKYPERYLKKKVDNLKYGWKVADEEKKRKKHTEKKKKYYVGRVSMEKWIC